MERNRTIHLAVFGLILLMLMSGCSGYGNLRKTSGDAGEVTIQDLVKNWADYNVYYSGYAVNNPSGIMFDLKKDDKTLTPSDRWVRLDSEADILEVVSWIDIHDYPWYRAELYKIIGPDGELYGFVYTGWHEIAAKVIDENTLLVYDLPDPPQYYGPNAEIKTL